MRVPSRLLKNIVFGAMLLLAFFASATRAQQTTAEVTAFAGHFFAGSYQMTSGSIDLDDAIDYGGIIDFPANRDVSVEISYTYARTHAKYYSFYAPLPGQDNYDTDVSINYFFIGALHEAKNGKVTPFGGAALGAVVFDPVQPQYGTTWRAALALQLGVKLDLADKVGLRIGGRFLFPLYIYGGTVWAGSGGGGYAVSAGIPIVQGDIMAGLTFKM